MHLRWSPFFPELGVVLPTLLHVMLECANAFKQHIDSCYLYPPCFPLLPLSEIFFSIILTAHEWRHISQYYWTEPDPNSTECCFLCPCDILFLTLYLHYIFYTVFGCVDTIVPHFYSIYLYLQYIYLFLYIYFLIFTPFSNVSTKCHYFYCILYFYIHFLLYITYYIFYF